MQARRQILSRREYEIERTVIKKTESNTEVHVTVKIVTSHDEVHQCMCNLGCNLTVGGVPSQSKQAFIQRTTCLFARDQTCNKDGSDDKEFEAKMKEPVVAERIAKFRLFVSMVSFVPDTDILDSTSTLIPVIAHPSRTDGSAATLPPSTPSSDS